MKAKEIISNQYVKASLLILAGLLLGWLFFHQPAGEHDHQHRHGNEESAPTVWTCSMHPQIRSDKPGKCPLCGMDLIPVSQGGEAQDPDALQMTEEAMRLAEVQTTVVSTSGLSRKLHLYGTVQMDEGTGLTLAAHVPGRIERLLVNTTGETVKKGQLIATIYSPELVNAQNDLLQAVKMGEGGKTLADAARRKLSLWKLTDDQIASIERSGTVQTAFNLYSGLSGVVVAKRVNEGDYVAQGAPLYDISDLGKVWILFDAYEEYLPWIRKGDQILFTTNSSPGKEYKGTVAFIDPVLDPQTRTVKVRVIHQNSDQTFKPGMFATGIIDSRINTGGNNLVVPASAVLWTGKRSVVYVKDPEAGHPTFKMRQVTLGASLGDTWVIEKGLEEGEEIVVQGTFEIDAAAQLSGKPSMMNPPVDHETMVSDPNMQMLDITVHGACGMCKTNIETAAKSVPGVGFAEWDKEKENLHVMFNKHKANQDQIEKAIARTGYDTENYTAPDDVYDKLPACCHYRDK